MLRFAEFMNDPNRI